MVVNQSDVVFVVIVGGLGTLAIAINTIIYLGFYRSVYMVKGGNPVFANKLHLGIPGILLGLLFLFITSLIIFPKPQRGELFNLIGIPLLLLSVVLGVWHPVWILPKWLRWLKKEHGDILGLLWEDARKRDRWEWERQVSTQEGLETWVAEVRRSHNLDEVTKSRLGE